MHDLSFTVCCWVVYRMGAYMEDGENNETGSNNGLAKAEWTTPVLIACGNMMNVMADSGTGSDGTGSGTQAS